MEFSFKSKLINGREHVNRVHLRAIQCARCGACWGDNGQFRRHQRNTEACKRLPTPELKDVPTADKARYEALKKSSGKTRTWDDFFRVLFPDTVSIPLLRKYINQSIIQGVCRDVPTVANYSAPERRKPTETNDEHTILAEETLTLPPLPPPSAHSTQPLTSTPQIAPLPQLASTQPVDTNAIAVEQVRMIMDSSEALSMLRAALARPEDYGPTESLSPTTINHAPQNTQP